MTLEHYYEMTCIERIQIENIATYLVGGHSFVNIDWKTIQTVVINDTHHVKPRRRSLEEYLTYQNIYEHYCLCIHLPWIVFTPRVDPLEQYHEASRTATR